MLVTGAVLISTGPCSVEEMIITVNASIQEVDAGTHNYLLLIKHDLSNHVLSSHYRHTHVIFSKAYHTLTISGVLLTAGYLKLTIRVAAVQYYSNNNYIIVMWGLP